jgi:uncharacterized protein DUF4292
MNLNVALAVLVTQEINKMNKIILSTLITGLIFTACHSTKMAQRAVPSQPVVTQSPAEKMKTVDSVAIIKDSLTNLINTPLDFTTFYGKAKADFSSDQASGNATVYIRMQKDSVIWISVTGPLNIEGARVLITPDSIKIINKLEGTAQLSSIKHLRQITRLPLGFTDFQNIILGKPSVINNAELNFDLKPDSIKVSAEQSSINYLFSFLRSNFVLGQSRFIASSNNNLVDANIFYNNYQTINGINFSADRSIAVTGTAPMKLQLSFKEYNFNQPQTFPFTISKNYTIKYD